MDSGLLILRVVVGLYLFGHGAQKLFGWFGGPGLKGASGFFMQLLGLRPAVFWTLVGSSAETFGGLLVVAGLFSPLGALALAAAMGTAIVTAHWSKGVWAQQGGFELPLTNLAVAVALALMGPGRYSLDAALGVALPEPATGIIGTALAIIGVGAALVSRKLGAATGQQPAPAGTR